MGEVDTVSVTADRGRAVRQRLLDAATELIVERGWSGVSTRALAERAEATPGLVHYHFASVQALLTDAAIGVMRGLVDELDELLRHAHTPKEALRLMLASMERASGHDPTSLLFIETYLAATRDADLRARLSEVISDFRSRLADWFGEHRVSRPMDTAAALTAAIDGIALHRALTPELSFGEAATVLERTLVPTIDERNTREAGDNE